MWYLKQYQGNSFLKNLEQEGWNFVAVKSPERPSLPLPDFIYTMQCQVQKCIWLLSDFANTYNRIANLCTHISIMYLYSIDTTVLPLFGGKWIVPHNFVFKLVNLFTNTYYFTSSETLSSSFSTESKTFPESFLVWKLTLSSILMCLTTASSENKQTSIYGQNCSFYLTNSYLGVKTSLDLSDSSFPFPPYPLVSQSTQGVLILSINRLS